MEETQIIYRIFTRLAVALGTLNGWSIKDAKKLTNLQFKQHPYQKEIKALIKNIDTDEHFGM